MRLNIWFKKIYAAFLLILFLGYYGSITSFYHKHIVLGDTIVHSHPFKTDKNGNPSHSHTDKGYITVHLLSCLAITLILLNFNFKTITPIVYEFVLKTRHGFIINEFYSIYSLRAPPSDMLK